MGTATIKKQSAVSVPLPATDELRLFVDTADDILKTKDSANVVRPSGVGTADELATMGAPVDVSAAAPPVAGDVLTATSPTLAIWSPPAPTGYAVTALQVGPGSYSAAVNEAVPVDVTAGLFTVNLPAGHAAGDKILVKLVGLATNNVVVDADGGEFIDGVLTFSLTTNDESAEFLSDGTNWYWIG
jgi:hypothetical protein